MLVYRKLFLGVIATVFLVMSATMPAMAEMLVLYCASEPSRLPPIVGSVIKYRFTINLDNNTATCEDKMEPVNTDYKSCVLSLNYRLQEITKTAITFRYYEPPRGDYTGVDATLSIDRTDGSFTVDWRQTNGHTENHRGTCRKGTQNMF